MPWLLDQETGDSRRVHWDDLYNDDGSDIAPEGWSDPQFIPPEATWPLPFRQTTKHKQIPDFCGGRYSWSLYVSQAFRDLIEAMDPVQHHFIPLHLYLHGGRESIGEYFLFKPGEFVDGIILEKSNAGPSYGPDGTLWFYSLNGRPRITWRASAIKGRHVWVDKYIHKRFFCSDEFHAEVKRRKMKLFDEHQCFISEE